MEAEKEFKRLLSRLAPATVFNEACVKFVRSYSGNLEVLLKILINEMSRSSLNGRVKQLNFLEYCAGIVGNCSSQPEWNDLVANNIQRLVDMAVPAHLAPPSLVNILPAQRFVDGFHAVGFIDDNTRNSILEQLRCKEQTLNLLGSSRKYQVNKEEILRRMEDDRERAKKYKEKQLAVKPGSDAEFERMWTMVTPFSKKDREIIRLGNELARLP